MGHFNCPVLKARLTSKFGWRNIGRGKEWHQGVDLCSPVAGMKAPVYSSADGVVAKVGLLGSYGNRVLITHTINGKTMQTLYAHLDKISVEEGQKVKQGEVIGIMGNTGGSFGVHLHFEIHNGLWSKGQPNAIDPMTWIELDTCKPYQDTPKPVTQPKKDYKKHIGYNAPKGASKVFRIHTDAFKSKQLAIQSQKDFVQKGYLRYAEVIGDDKVGYRLQSGKYLTQKECESVAIKLLENNLIGYASIIGSQQ